MHEKSSPDAVARLIDPEFLREVRKGADREMWRSLYTKLIQLGASGVALTVPVIFYLIMKNDEASDKLLEPMSLVGGVSSLVLFWGAAGFIKQAFYGEPALTKEEKQVQTFN